MWKWLLDKAWELGMRWFPKPKSAAERLAALQLREREIEDQIPVYIPQLKFAFSQLAHEYPGANALPIAELAKALDVSPEQAAEIVRVLVKQEHLEPLHSPGASGETLYMFAPPVTRPRLSRL
jgi:hypothetical protein